MKKINFQNIVSFIIVLLLFSNFNEIKAAVVCGSTGDGYRCHYSSTVGNPPPMFHTFGDRIMTGGVGNYGNNRRYYWIDTNFTSTYTNPIQTAVSEWVNTTAVTTSISIRQTTTRSSAYFEIVRNDNLGPGVLGRTDFFVYSTPILINPDGTLQSNYGWTLINLNTNTIGTNSTQIKTTTSHELGHGMGLSHQNCKVTSIMCQTSHGRTAERADTKDLQTINHLYN